MRRFPKLFVLGAVAGAMVVALAVIGIASAGRASAITYSSTFDSGAEGWTDAWSSAGGNPGGYLTAHVDSGDFGAVFASSTRSAWVPGNLLDDYGGSVQVDLEGSDVDEAVILLISNNSSLVPCRSVGVMAMAWTTYSVDLDPGLAGLSDCRTGKPLTPSQLSAALAGFVSIEVEVANQAVGSYDLGLDNALLSGPQVAAKPPTGRVPRKFTRFWRHGDRLGGSLTAATDYSCAGKKEIAIFWRSKKQRVEVAKATTRQPSLKFGPASFSVRLKTVRNGFYYASIARSKSPLDGNTCDATRSKGIRVRQG